MSINPVPGIRAVREEQLGGSNLPPSRSRTSAAEVEKSADPDPGTSPSQEIRDSQNVPAPAELPQDEVQVQREGQADNEIVIKYLDHSGNLILQVPSSQVLGVAQAIDQDLEEQAKAHAAEAGGEGGKTHGH